MSDPELFTDLQAELQVAQQRMATCWFWQHSYWYGYSKGLLQAMQLITDQPIKGLSELDDLFDQLADS